MKHKQKPETPLCKLAYKYGTDKCPKIKHSYTPYYYSLFKDIRRSVKLVFEMGIGFYNNMQNIDKKYDPQLKRWYQKGAGLKMWRDFFPKATIIGADIKPATQFTEERIITRLCDEKKPKEVKNLLADIGKNIDIFIDDGSHKKEDQALLAKTALPLLKKTAIYIIEDVRYSNYICKHLEKYDCKVVEFDRGQKDDRLIIIRKT